MKKLTSLGVAAFAALLTVLAVLGSSSPAQAYPEIQINLVVNRSVLYGGETFTATASSNGTTCSWALEWNGDTRHGTSSGGDVSPFKATYTAPQVTKVTKIPLHGTCEYAAPSARGSAIWQRTIMITVLPPSSAVSPPGGSDLPSTGGPNLLFLGGGLLLLLSGAAAVTVARRRAEDAEIQASRA
jgi:LPXTG-motif cell wall-anchored protein